MIFTETASSAWHHFDHGFHGLAYAGVLKRRRFVPAAEFGFGRHFEDAVPLCELNGQRHRLWINRTDGAFDLAEDGLLFPGSLPAEMWLETIAPGI
jgi:hypothetical protein